MAVNVAQFLAGIESPVTRVQQGVTFGQQQADRRAQQEAAQVQAEQQKKVQAELLALSQKENRTADDFQDLIIRNPGLAQTFQTNIDQLNEEAKAATISEATNVFAALSSGNNEAALKIVEDRREAAVNSGNQQEVQKADVLIQAIKTDPKAALTSAGLFLATATGDKFASTLEAVQKVSAPKQIKFTNVVEIGGGKFAGISSETGQFENIKTAITGDTLKQLDFANKESKLKFEQTSKLVDTAKKDKRINDFLEVSTKFDRVQTAGDTAAGDISLIFAFMKMLDPTSVVREGEFATAQNSGSVPENIMSAYNRALTGERLLPERRADFKNQSQAIFDRSKETADKTLRPIEKRAKKLGLDAETIREQIFGIQQEAELPEGLPPGTVDNKNGTFTLPDGTVVEPE